MVTNDNGKVVNTFVTVNQVVTFLTFLIMVSKITTFVVKMSGVNIPATKKCHNPRYNNNYQIDKNVKNVNFKNKNVKNVNFEN